MENNVVLEMRGICMTFPGVKALENVDFTLRKGEIRALMGENGAGKSTLIKCLTGVNKFEAGEIFLEGIEGPIVNKDTMDAQKKGISTVYQEVNLCPNLSVAENLFIGREPMTKFGTVDRKKMIDSAALTQLWFSGRGHQFPRIESKEAGVPAQSLRPHGL